MTGRAVLGLIGRRLLVLGVLLFVISFGVFCLMYIAPGSVINTLLGANPHTQASIRALKEQFHLNEPFLAQYFIWLRDAAQLHFGDSAQTTLPVIDEVKSRLPVSLFLGIYAFILTMIAGVGLGIVAALKRQTTVDRGVVASAVVGLSTPAFVAGVILLYVFGILMPLFPVFGSGSGFLDRLWHLTLPAVSLALGATAYVVKHTRAALIGVLDQDYVTFAKARGLSPSRVLLAYGLRNALIPVVTISGVTLAFLITGSVLVEVTFSLGGIGELLVQSATAQDLPMLQGVSLLIAIVIMLLTLVADLLYIAVDPRIRLGGLRR